MLHSLIRLQDLQCKIINTESAEDTFLQLQFNFQLQSDQVSRMVELKHISNYKKLSTLLEIIVSQLQSIQTDGRYLHQIRLKK